MVCAPGGGWIFSSLFYPTQAITVTKRGRGGAVTHFSPLFPSDFPASPQKLLPLLQQSLTNTHGGCEHRSNLQCSVLSQNCTIIIGKRHNSHAAKSRQEYTTSARAVVVALRVPPPAHIAAKKTKATRPETAA